MGTTTALSSVDARETANLIGSDKVEGTAVYATDGSKIGSIQRVMIDKVSGKVAYAVMSFGGFLRMGEDYYPVPWSMLNYDTGLEGDRTNLTKEQIERAPKYSASTGWNCRHRSHRDHCPGGTHRMPLSARQRLSFSCHRERPGRRAHC